MDVLLPELRAMNAGLGAPTTPEQLHQLELALGWTLPSALSALYRAFNGQDPTQTALVFRLLNVREVLDVLRDGDDWFGLPPDARVFFSDDRGNHAFVYLDGPLRGKVGLYDHDEPLGTPNFRSVPSFLVHLLSSGNRRDHWDFRGMSRDYPARVDRHTAAELEADRALFAYYRERYETSSDEDMRLEMACTAMNLLPHQNSDLIFPFAQDPEPGVAEEACAQLGLRAWEAAIPLLRQVALEGHANPRNAAVCALGMIPSPAAGQALVDFLMRLAPTPQTWSAALALQQHGFTVVLETDGTGRIRARHDQPWQAFPQRAFGVDGDI